MAPRASACIWVASSRVVYDEVAGPGVDVGAVTA
ncbi:hypothetical protein EV643_12539 [Kribbella sp. VKM Ac-2527]|uniref:Uncharacterized protein n=1 Tax=Kribbella caucasensis TaxID=2512215 RepID=A0A4R6JGH2_9ACTN|nr:hypothetical protein EV643_12539 [Kribbella sp. VKM Ac-2527]